MARQSQANKSLKLCGDRVLAVIESPSVITSLAIPVATMTQSPIACNLEYQLKIVAQLVANEFQRHFWQRRFSLSE